MKKLYFLCLAFYWGSLASGQTLAPSPAQNFVRVESVLISGRTTDAQVLSLNDSQKTVSFQYSDGLGRNTQTVIWRGSPQKRDLVYPFVYGIGNTEPVEYLPYRSTATTGGFRTGAFTEQAAFYNSPSAGITSDSRPRRNNSYEPSPFESLTSTTYFGSGFENNGIQAEMQVNVASQVRRWDIVSGLPRSTAFYPAGSLSLSITKDASQFTTRTFTDWLGRKVLSQVQTGTSTWEDTYYVYNDYGQLLFVIPPAASTNLTPTQAVANLWFFRYEYDDFGRMTGSKAPGTGWAYTVYDRWDRPVLSQDSVQRAKSPQEWSFVKYDVHNRPVITGTFTTASSRSSLTTAVANSATRDEIKNSSAIGYTLNRTYPTTVTETGVLTVEYYDDYDFLNISSWSPNNSQFSFVAESGYTGARITAVKGLLTGSKTRLIGNSSNWEHTVLHYDKYYQPIQVISSHQLNGRIKTVTQYAFSGEVEKTVNIYSYGGTTTRIQRRFTYDHAKRPLNVYHQVNSNSEVLLSGTLYNELGRPFESIHHSRDNGTNWLYKSISKNTTQGWLDEIKYVYSNNTVVFSQKLDYDKSAGNGNNTRLDGLITSNKWQHHGSQPERSYTYSYNTPKRLTASTFRQKSGTTWTANNFYNEDNILYSSNGNITSLRRNSEKSGASAQIDNLTYTYSGNRLTGVSDSAPTANRPDGFNDGNTSGDDYVYNGNGFVTTDKNKGITAITYNILDRPTRIDFGTGPNIRYTYSSGGGLRTVTYHSTSSGAATKTIQYIGELVFENGVLTDINHEFGRVLANNGFRYQYYLADYLGSTRVVLQEDPAVFTSSATFENYAAEEEEEQFIGYEEAVRISADFLNHTSGPESTYSMRLTGGYGENVGLAKSLSVMPGDTVRMEVYGKYIDIAEAKRNPAIMAVLMAITAADPMAMGIDGGLAASSRAIGSESGGLAGLLTSKKEIGDAPPAYLNYLFFDREMNFKYGGFVQMTNAAREDGSNVSHEKLSQKVVAEEPGYFYIYLSNDSNTGSEAFFDDFTIMTSESYIVQEIDYYPYGMVAREFRRLGDKHTNDLFQGKTYEDLTKWYDFHARQYDAALGRWFGVDPQNQFASPYLAMGNNPVMMVDPDGELAWFIPIIAGAVIGGVSQGIASSNSGGSFWNGAWKGALIGAASGAAGIGAGAWAAGASFTSVASGATALGLGGSLAAGAAAGFTSGAGSTWLGGGSFGQGLGSGFKGAALGAATAGALYGLSKGAGTLAMRSSRKAFMESALAFNEYAVDQSTGAISQISTLGGSDTHFYHVGTWSDAGTAFQSGRTFIVDGANTINSFRFWESASSTISAFSVPASGLTGYFLERPGPSTTVANQNLRIPAGSYQLTPNMNSYPGDYMVFNENVSAGRGITIHSGNNPGNTRGCLLPGCGWGGHPEWGSNWVSGSVIKRNELRAFIKSVGYKNVRLKIHDVF